MSKDMLGMLPLSEVRGPRDTLETNLAGKEGPIWLDALKKLNRKENPWPSKPPQFPFSVWKTIVLRVYTTGRGYLKASGTHMSEDVRRFLLDSRSERQMNYRQIKEEIDLVTISVGELGFEEETTSRIHARGIEMGLELCFPEDAIALTLLRIEELEELIMAMHTVVPDGPRAFVFFKRELHFVPAGPLNVWTRQTIFIFRKPRR